MKTLAITLAGIVATLSLATAEGVTKPDAADPTADPGGVAYSKFDGNRAGEEREFAIAPGVKMTFCWSPAGEFVMGSPKYEQGRDGRDEDQVKVALTKGFWIAKTELTQAQCKAVMGSSPFDGAGLYGRPFPESMKAAENPVAGVSWDDAQAFMKKPPTPAWQPAVFVRRWPVSATASESGLFETNYRWRFPGQPSLFRVRDRHFNESLLKREHST